MIWLTRGIPYYFQNFDSLYLLFFPKKIHHLCITSLIFPKTRGIPYYFQNFIPNFFRNSTSLPLKAIPYTSKCENNYFSPFYLFFYNHCPLRRFQRHAGPLVTAAVSILAFLSPIAMVAIPRTNLIDLTERQLRCEVSKMLPNLRTTLISTKYVQACAGKRD